MSQKMSVSPDLTGQKFGKLTPLRRNGVRVYGKAKKVHAALWTCICDCGREHDATSYSLRTGKVKSCGCYRLEVTRKEPGSGGFSDLFSGYKRNARTRNLGWHLTKDEMKSMTKERCWYCHAEPSAKSVSHRERSIEAQKHEEYTYNGLDRVDNTKGYTIDNVVPCCKTCNFIKRDLPFLDFVDKIRTIATLSYANLRPKIDDFEYLQSIPYWAAEE